MGLSYFAIFVLIFIMGFKARRLSSGAKKLSYMKQIVLQKKRKPKHNPAEFQAEKLVKIEEKAPSGLFSETKFADLEICDPLKAALKSLNFTNLT